MLIKWIVCRVPDGLHAAFSKAQTGWSALQGVDGFGGQWGGWNVFDSEEACIIGLWRDAEAYRFFMEQIHDIIFEKSAQGRTYSEIFVTLYEGAEVASLPERVLNVRMIPELQKARLVDGILYLPSDAGGEKRLDLLDAWYVEGGAAL
ncbi:YdbC family protein [Tumebacillus sp. ITR2]|uniref:YdbC family protein n=1 Tax=Tumebacillus amylolyticus TaxID=2801339 RepID=A0ABS1JA53_9BACL|nr:YdbC family protein [Tumebacillus amylolyticus]MBL0387152.1 YdbC family protein [Tumebacillus amylolyticus]